MAGAKAKITARPRPAQTTVLQALIAAALLGGLGNAVMAQCKCDVSSKGEARKGYDITPTDLKPRYPEGFQCSPLTSLYASWIDVDGSIRNEIHSGVDGGRLGDRIVAPAPGIVHAVWRANWGWGEEGALLIKHTGGDLNLSDEEPVYYSEFDHLRFEEINHFQAGERISRGQPLAHVFRPGGDKQYLPEVHWEVWEIGKEDKLSWRINKFGGRYWVNDSGRLIDPLYLLALNSPPDADGGVLLTPFVEGRDYSGFRGFTYILPC